MPTIDEAMERAIRAIRDFDDPGSELAIQYARAALSAFLANVPVSEAGAMAASEAFEASEGDHYEGVVADGVRAYCAKLAEEIQ